MSGFPLIPSRSALGVDWDMGTAQVRNPKEEVSDKQLNLLGWQMAGLGVGVPGIVWALIKGADGSLLASGEGYNPNGLPSLKLANATAWQALTGYTIGTLVANGGSLYKATAGGTSAASGGPSGTGGAIVDGSVTWAFQSSGGYCLRQSTGIYVLAYQATYNDETGTPQPLTLQVAGSHHQSTNDYRTAQSVTGVNVVTVYVRTSGGAAVDDNVFVYAR